MGSTISSNAAWEGRRRGERTEGIYEVAGQSGHDGRAPGILAVSEAQSEAEKGQHRYGGFEPAPQGPRKPISLHLSPPHSSINPAAGRAGIPLCCSPPPPAPPLLLPTW